MRLQTMCLVGVLLAGTFAYAEPAIYVGPDATGVERLAATELQRYLYIGTGGVLPIEAVKEVPKRAEGFVLGTPQSLPKTGVEWPFGLEAPAADGYILRSERKDNGLVIIAGATPQAAQNGVYGFLEELGFGFYLSGDTYPQEGLKVADIDSARLNVSKSPAFAVRGTLPWMNFFDSPTTWEWEDYKAYIDQLVRMRCNFVGFHAYDNEPFAAFQQDGKWVDGEPLVNTSKPNWGTQPLAVDKFFAGTADYFDGAYFGAASSFVEDREASIAAAKELLRKALTYAKSRGLKACLGFEVRGDAFDAANQARFEARLKALLDFYPMVDCVWLWQPEGMGLNAPSDPAQRSLWDSYAEHWSDAFGDIKEDSRKAEAARMTLYMLHAHDVLQAVRPDVQLVVSGWGGDEWLRCTDFFPGMDKLLPGNVAFSALDNSGVTPAVSEAYGKLAAERQRWPIVWFEYDGDQWMAQPNLHQTAGACADAVEKGCQGLLGIHWRTRSVDETAAYCARFAWDQSLTVESFLERRARDLFGPELGAAVAPSLLKLDDLGYRWVGGEGQSERGVFSWQNGIQDRRGQLARIGYELHSMAKEKGVLLDLVPNLIPELVPELNIQPVDQAVKVITQTVQTVTDVAGKVTEVTGKVENQLVPKPVKEIKKGLTGGLKDTFLPSSLRPQSSAALQDLIRQIEFVLAYEEAADLLGPNGGLDDLVLDEKVAGAIDLVKNSKLPEAMHVYAARVANKGELGVLATMNTKAWTNLRKRLGASDETLALLEQAPERIKTAPRILMLPDRIIAVGMPKEELSATLKAKVIGDKRALTEKQFIELPLKSMGRLTFALAFPDELVKAANEAPVNVAFGIEVKAKGAAAISWPAGFPNALETATLSALPETAPTPAAPGLEVKPVEAKVTVVPERYSAQLTWNAQDGALYTVSRDGQELGTVSDGWFEDLAIPSGKPVEYSITARSAVSDKVEVAKVSAQIPELPLPVPPQKIQVSTRGNRAVLGWTSDAPQAAQYVVAKHDENGIVVEEIRVAADFGQFLQISSAVRAGEVCSYTVAGVAPDGRVGQPSPETGVIASSEPLKPELQLSVEDPAFLTQMADLAKKGTVLGGRGWAELPTQAEWDLTHELTLNLWANLEDLEGMPVLLCKGAWQQSGYYIQIFQKQIRFYLAGVDTLDAGSPEAGALETGKWQLITATYGHGQMRVYLNGKLVGCKHVTGHPRTSADLLLENRYGQSDDAYSVRGSLDDIRMYDVALTEGEVEALYNETKRE